MHYIQEHLRILSGFYGIVKPFDGVTPYRLEMQAKLMGEVQKKMTAISTDIAKERKLDLLLERSEGGVVYFNNTFDITAELVKRYKAGK